MTHADDRGVVRQDHYGAGRQPWDDIVEQGWAIEFSAGNVLKYLRRTKEPEHSLESARWYLTRLHEFGDSALTVRDALYRLLTPAELRRLRGDPD